ncbi:MAG: hypothetical protein QG639_1085, partial [Patescibacteria group bacterium]|nr:hypothetical protein [Patescibacteria group bacterium]
PEIRLLSKSVYNLVNAFEGTAQNIDFVNMRYTGSFEDLDGKNNTNFKQRTYEEMEYNGRSGVTEWGIGPEYHAGAVTYMFVNDPFDTSNYRGSTGPIAWFIKGSDKLMKEDKLYLPATIGQPRKMLDSLHASSEPYPLIANSNQEKENVHFVLNSFQAFEHVIGYLYTTNTTYLNRME